MAEPKQKSLELPAYLTRVLPLWQTPQWMEAERWRRVTYNIPGAIICRDVLTSDLIASDWEIRAKNPKEEDALAEHIEYYTDVLNPDMGGGIIGFDAWIERMGQDMLSIPVGGNSELVRWPVESGPLNRPHAKGHVHKIAYMDGATVFPTYDRDLILGQRIREDATNVVYFRRDEVCRMVISPRPEMQRWGYGMPPPEKIYLAITLLFRGDQYYANLLLDTPEAGILDLMDMSQKAATEWVGSFKTLHEGIDPMKIGVGYEHEKPWQWIPFTRPPAEMMFDRGYVQYLQITHAGYGLTLTDTGLGEPQRTLAGSIRDERRSQRSGFAVAREKVRSLVNTDILPDYLEFAWITKDEEAKVQRGRSFVLAAQALKAAKEANFISAREGQAQLLKDGHLTVEVEEPEEQEPMPALPFGTNPFAQRETERVPASEGGRGDITGNQQQKAEVGTRVAAVPPGSPHFDQLAGVLRQAFGDMLARAERARILKLVKIATRTLFPQAEKALAVLSDEETPFWLEQRALMWFGAVSEFDGLPDIQKQMEGVFEALEKALEKDAWWLLPADPALLDPLTLVLQLSYQEGAGAAAQTVQELLYSEGLADNPSLIGLNFQLSNPQTLARIAESGAQLVRRVNESTKFYLKRIVTQGVEEGLASPAIAKMIKDGADVEAILKEAGYTEGVIKRAQEELGHMADMRLNSIVNTEIARAETEGRVGQWEHMGLTRKAWMHTGATGADDPCPVCTANIDMGFVPIDYMYESVFGPATVLGPPAHPQTDHCHIIFSEDELMGKAGELEVWSGA